ncbi:esterase-like activity of phytase family protein [Sediminibacterium soli]|uniref:esterase-like activity of phytase family protein n=1 Tax=Sediminibacterium soli TaxID=2698829 RepID=UPI0013799CFC|nr:esterase-like activity of phytase family protein [Sediminibacterium soli]NCI47864.1 esterase-like activity of phytase family protein [Sediminibacterium soli]
MTRHFLYLCLLFASCTVAKKAAKETQQIGGLQLLSHYEVPHNFLYRSTVVGGLSGIDYDKDRDQYYLISDDRSSINPARFYTARIHFNGRQIDSVSFLNTTTLLQANGNPYPDSKQDPARTPDPEAIRYNPKTGQLVWSSEGERIVKPGTQVIADPSINIITADGKFVDSFPIADNLHMHTLEKGPRQNGVLEGMSFADDYRSLYLNVEEPLYEDGPRAATTPNNAWIRIYKFDVATRKNTAQYAYHLDPVAHPPLLENSFIVNGVPDILWLEGNKMIVMERSFSTGRLACTIKLYLADLADAENIIGNTSLIKTPPQRPLQKKLLLNLDSLNIYTDNIEGMTFGPVQPNGHKTLVLVADNNFAALEKTQFFVFEVIP